MRCRRSPARGRCGSPRRRPSRPRRSCPHLRLAEGIGDRLRSPCPSVSVASSCCGTEKLTYDGTDRLQRHDRCAAGDVLAEVDLADAEDAGERRADGLALDRGLDLSTFALGRLELAPAPDRRSPAARCRSSRSPWLRSRSRRASSRCASAAASCARSCRVSSRTSTSPLLTEFGRSRRRSPGRCRAGRR